MTNNNASAAGSSTPRLRLAGAADVQLRGSLGDAFRLGTERLSLDPYRSAAFLRSDFSFETNRVFVNYSGDISGRFIEVASLLSPRGRMAPATLPEVLRDIGTHQRADGHFGRDVDWSEPLEPESPNARLLPIFWGNSRLLVGLVEAHLAFGRPDLLKVARRLGDFYINSAGRFLDSNRVAEYRSTGSYAAGYVTDYFPGIEGLARLFQVTQEPRFLAQAERMAEFFRQFDTLPIDHSHGNLTTHRGLLLLYEITGKAEYLERVRNRWLEAVEGGYVWPSGGVGERFRISNTTDEGCSEADWLMLNLRLWHLTGDTRCLDMADRLLWNHYTMNRTANGGYGHHQFVCDREGPLLMKPDFTEAVWCCTFHGLLGLHTLRRHLIATSDYGILINLPVAFSASVTNDSGAWQVELEATETTNSWTCRVRVEPTGRSSPPPELRMRLPAWADHVSLMNPQGQAVPFQRDRGYCVLPMQTGQTGAITVRFGWKPRAENRRLTPLRLPVERLTSHRGVALFNGPRMLLANSQNPRPVIVGRVDKDGHLRLPFASDGSVSLLTAPTAEAKESDIAEATKKDTRLTLAPWEQARHDAPVAFVFDLITVLEP